MQRPEQFWPCYGGRSLPLGGRAGFWPQRAHSPDKSEKVLSLIDTGGLFGSVGAAVGGGYSNTAEGKVIVAAFMDSYNGVVRAVRNYKAQTVKGGLGTGGNLAVQGAGDPSMTVMEAQTRLNELGFNVGTPDGSVGPRTRAQLKKFQQSRKIPTTGIVDEETAAELSK